METTLETEGPLSLSPGRSTCWLCGLEQAVASPNASSLSNGEEGCSPRSEVDGQEAWQRPCESPPPAATPRPAPPRWVKCLTLHAVPRWPSLQGGFGAGRSGCRKGHAKRAGEAGGALANIVLLHTPRTGSFVLTDSWHL